VLDWHYFTLGTETFTVRESGLATQHVATGRLTGSLSNSDATKTFVGDSALSRETGNWQPDRSTPDLS
jgi:hypothetical protein